MHSGNVTVNDPFYESNNNRTFTMSEVDSNLSGGYHIFENPGAYAATPPEEEPEETPEEEDPDRMVDYVNGCIEFKRRLSDGSEPITLEYMEKSEFDELISQYNTSGSVAARNEVMKHYTIDEQGIVQVATWSSHRSKNTSNDPEESNYDEETYSMTTTAIDYRNVIPKTYTLSFEYLWSLVGYASKDFALALVDEVVYDENLPADEKSKSYIYITVHDNETITTNEMATQYEKRRKVQTDLAASVTVEATTTTGDDEYMSTNFGSGTQTVTTKYGPFTYSEYEMGSQEEVVGSYTTTKTDTFTTNSVTVAVTEANVWIVKYLREYEYVAAETTGGTPNTNVVDVEGYTESPNRIITNIADAVSRESETIFRAQSESNALAQVPSEAGTTKTAKTEITYFRQLVWERVGNENNQKEVTTTNTIITTKYQETPPEIIEKTMKETEASEEDKENGLVPNFVSILSSTDFANTRYNLVSGGAGNWWIEALEKNPDTKYMVDISKYLLNKVSGRSMYGVEFNPSDYEMGAFTSVSSAGGIVGGNAQEKVWFALRGAGYSEIATAAVMGNIYQESKWDPAIENGIGAIGLIQWLDRAPGLRNYAASKGTDWTDVNTQIEFLLAELTVGGGAGGFANYQFGDHKSDWENATSIATATEIFARYFERCGEGEMMLDVRVTAAQQYYDEFKGKTAPSVGSDDRIGQITLSGANATNMQAMLIEALRIADGPYEYSMDTDKRNNHDENGGWFDCSSFVQYLYQKAFGINVGSVTGDIASKMAGNAVSMSSLQPGDILYTDGHVGIYLGNGKYVHAANPTDGIIISSNVSAFSTAFRPIK